jgi:hypothetical protein
MAAKLDLLDQQRLAGAAIFGTLVGKRMPLAFASSAAGFRMELVMDFWVELLMA